VPANAAFSAKTVALDQVPANVDSWLLIHTFRIGLAAVASVLGVIAVSLQAAAQ
jgi:hypothetical protein